MERHDTISFKGKRYPIYELVHPEYRETVLVSTEELNNAVKEVIENEKSTQKQKDKAIALDEMFYCYMSAEVLKGDRDDIMEDFVKHYV